MGESKAKELVFKDNEEFLAESSFMDPNSNLPVEIDNRLDGKDGRSPQETQL